MSITRRDFLTATGMVGAAGLVACGQTETEEQTETSQAEESPAVSSSLSLDSAAWLYNADDDVYYQIGIPYCESPADESYENLAVFVPGKFFLATDNGDGTFTCEVDASATVGSFTAQTAPIVIPVNTPGYSAQAALTDYESKATFTDRGLVYVHAGCRGRDAGAPAGVVDLKAAVRLIRFVSGQIAGDTERIFTFGMSGGGAQSALMGATGDSSLYDPYLEAIGAVSGVSDVVLGSMDWCPITGLDVADEAYEWMMGCTREGLSEDEQAISDGLAEAFAAYINSSSIPGEDGAVLRLEESEDGIYQAGSYYECVLAAVEESLNNFLADTEFPYDASSSAGGMGGPGGMGAGMGGPGGGMRDGELPEGDFDGNFGELPEGEMPEGGPGGKGGMGRGQKIGANGGGEADGATSDVPDTSDVTPEALGENTPFEDMDNISRTQTTSGITLSGTYETAADYVAALNADGEWVSYDEKAGTVTITSVADFCKALKQASKSLGAFDQLDCGQGENTLFGQDGDPSHFDSIMAGVLNTIGNAYASDYEDDLARIDSLGVDVQTRVNMYTPLYYLLESFEGWGQSEPAKHWRIRTGIEQGDTALTTELNLALALKADTRVESVDFATVWGQGHTQAERTGSSDENFIAWIEDLLAS